MNRKWVLLCDTREKKPLMFPGHLEVLDDTRMPEDQKTIRVQITTVKQKLDTGDYALQGYEDQTLVERKGSLREIAKNCLDSEDRKRFIRCLERMRKVSCDPLLLMEGTPLLLSRPTRYVKKPSAAIDALLRLLKDYGVRILLLPTNTYAQRRACGEWVLREMITGAINASHSSK